MTHKYGRGKFETHPNYVTYMSMIVSHENYRDMPNAVSANGRINWQVSSGVSTSFYLDYLARRAWWERKADELGVPKTSADRYTTVARLIHPTGMRACRLCGDSFYVGYMYANQLLVNRLKKYFPTIAFKKGQSIAEVIDCLRTTARPDQFQSFFSKVFPERQSAFDRFGVGIEAFRSTMQIRSQFLTPGFMGNPPDRLDGFHDYHFECRKINDPGRSDSNMRSYSHDRRTFEWWAEGNWAIADAIYNAAGAGTCSIPGCARTLNIVSPDHVGPLACGFKQLGLFVPTCPAHNSAKNRRFTVSDTRKLIKYEEATKESAASWQIRSHWDKYKNAITNDNESKALSNSLRSLQDMYLRTLWLLHRSGQTRFLSTLLHPEYAFLDVEIVGLDPSRFTYKEVATSVRKTKNRNSLAARTVRIAFEALEEYVRKPASSRKLVRSDYRTNIRVITECVKAIVKLKNQTDLAWVQALADEKTIEEREVAITLLLESGERGCETDEQAFKLLKHLFDQIGEAASVDFRRYGQEDSSLE